MSAEARPKQAQVILARIAQALGKVDDAGKSAVRVLLFKMLKDEQVVVLPDGCYTLPSLDPDNGGNGGRSIYRSL
jgi:hypothetical protein